MVHRRGWDKKEVEEGDKGVQAGVEEEAAKKPRRGWNRMVEFGKPKLGLAMNLMLANFI